PFRQALCHQSLLLLLLFVARAITLFISSLLCDNPMVPAPLAKNNALPSEGVEDKTGILFFNIGNSLPCAEASAAICTHLSSISFINIFCLAASDWISFTSPKVQRSW